MLRRPPLIVMILFFPASARAGLSFDEWHHSVTIYTDGNLQGEFIDLVANPTTAEHQAASDQSLAHAVYSIAWDPGTPGTAGSVTLNIQANLRCQVWPRDGETSAHGFLWFSTEQNMICSVDDRLAYYLDRWAFSSYLRLSVVDQNDWSRRPFSYSDWASAAAGGVVVGQFHVNQEFLLTAGAYVFNYEFNIQSAAIASGISTGDGALALTMRPAPPLIAGDTNCDFQLAPSDIQGFIQAILDREAYIRDHGDCLLSQADVNGDGLVNGLDIPPFIERLLGT